MKDKLVSAEYPVVNGGSSVGFSVKFRLVLVRMHNERKWRAVTLNAWAYTCNCLSLYASWYVGVYLP